MSDIERRPLGQEETPRVGFSSAISDEVTANEARCTVVRQLAAAARQDAHALASLTANGGGYKPVPGPVDDGVLRQHLYGGARRGVYLIEPGSDSTRLAVIDLDDHLNENREPVGWECVREVAQRLAKTAQDFGLQAWCVRSSGGRGIHLWFIWDRPQAAATIRALMNDVVNAEGYSVGDGGLATGQVEVFPKQDRVEPGSYGNLIALPFSGKSAPLDRNFAPTDTPPLPVTSAPLARLPEAHGRGRRYQADADLVVEALGHVSADDHSTWINVGLALKFAFGDDGFDIWNEWSRKSEKYPGADEAERRWLGFKPDGRRDVGTVYWYANEESGWKKPTSAGGRSSAWSVFENILKTVELWRDERGRAFATVAVVDHREHLAVEGMEFSRWLSREYHLRQRRAAPTQALKQAVELAAGEARFGRDVPERIAWTRVAVNDGRLYLDLADDSRSVVEVARDGWRVLPEAPVCFVRGANARPLPTPASKDGAAAVRDLRKLINVGDDNDMMLIVAWLVSALRPGRPQPILYLAGEQGSAKTSALKTISRLIDPQVVAAGSPPRNVDDLIVAAKSRWIVTVDNVSSMGWEMADAYCRLATGGGIEKRKNYTDEDLVAIDVLRPVLMTGITPATERPDFLDRVILVTLPALTGKWRDEETLETEFAAVQASILGALLDGAATALARLDETRERLKREKWSTRMNDFAVFAEAAGSVFGWEPGAFVAAYGKMIDVMMVNLAEAEPVVAAIAGWLESQGTRYEGKATDLHRVLTNYATGEGYGRLPRDWPRNPTQLGKWLRRHVKVLRAAGVGWSLTGAEQNRPQHHLWLLDATAPTFNDRPLDG